MKQAHAERRRRRDRRGMVLIIVLVVLAVLSLLVSAFAVVTRLETEAARNHLEGERARFLAWSGLEAAKFELRRMGTTPAYPAAWVAYHPGEHPQPPIEQATHPSFRLHLDPVPSILTASPARVPYPSGVMGSTHYRDPDNPQFGGDYYTLRVTDANGLIFLNDTNPHLRRMLDTLGAYLGLSTSEVGRKILAARPPGGFRSVSDIRTVFSNQDDYRAIAPFLTCHAWMDHKVVEMGEQYTAPDTGQATRSLRPATLALQSRAPISLNSAPVPVLVAVLEGIGYKGSPGAPGVSVSPALAETIAKAIVDYRLAAVGGGGSVSASPMTPQTRRYGFQSWGEFYGFLRTIPGVSEELAAIVLANCNPNTDLNKLNPDLSYYRPVDKTDLTSATTELCLASGGIFKIESLGVVLDDEGEVVATAKVAAVVRVFERYVDTTQADFEANRVDADARNPAFAGLRDLTTLPEYRNTLDKAQLDRLHEAEYDGQVSFNMITETDVSVDGVFAGYIRGHLDAEDTADNRIPMLAPYPLVRGGPEGNPKSVIGGSSAPNILSPDYAGGSDLFPAGVRSSIARGLGWDQADAIKTVHHEVPQSDIILTDGHGNYQETLATIPGWDYFAVDAVGFELWFKPDFNDPGLTTTGRQYLIDWEGGEPEPATTSFDSSDLTFDPQDFRDAVHEVYDDNVANYLAAVVAGGPGPDSPTRFDGIEHPMGALGIPPPPPSSLFYDGGPLPFGNFPYGQGADETTPGVMQDAETFAQLIEDYYTQALADLLNESMREVEEAPEEDTTTWGAKGHLQVWLEPAGRDGVSEYYTLKARFRIDAKNEEGTFSADYVRTWTYPGKIRAGTWHHLLFSFWALPPPGGGAPPDRMNFAVDSPDGGGVLVPSSTTVAAYPTEQHAQARIAYEVARSVTNVAVEFDPEDYRVPIEFPLGEIVSIGRDNRGGRAFRGLIDNVIFQGNWPKVPAPAATPDPPDRRRFDDYRPSLDKVVQINLATPSAGDDIHLFYNKRTPILEWDKSITVMGYHWTAWRYSESSPDGFPDIPPGGSHPVGLI
ncbi:MAG: hypothetical protein D6731_23965 [Planctomycetota bacterium]|nr:MAG: hypothetical protein D6731_23965 [Planctomycetota bacterium]